MANLRSLEQPIQKIQGQYCPASSQVQLSPWHGAVDFMTNLLIQSFRDANGQPEEPGITGPSDSRSVLSCELTSSVVSMA